MHRSIPILAGALTAAMFAASAASAEITLTVQYPYARTVADLHEEIANRFMEQHPDIKIKFLAPASNYEDAAQRTLRAALTGNPPDVAYHGLNLVKTFVDRNMAVPISDFLAADGGAENLGYLPSMVDMLEFDGKSYGLPFSISTPILYVNADLVRQAGGSMDNFPTDWESIVALGKKIEKTAENDVTGFFFRWAITGNWSFQSLAYSAGGEMMNADETEIQFDGPAGQYALDTLAMFHENGMPNISGNDARSAFPTGKIGILMDSTSAVSRQQAAVGDSFDFQTVRFPLAAENAALPAGGNAAVIFATDPEKQRAAWEYVKFATGAVGQTLMVNHTGYMPSNQRAIEGENYLAKFYDENPNHKTSLEQLPVMRGWYAFPGENSLKIIDVIKDHLESVVIGAATPDAALTGMTEDVTNLLPVN